LLLALPIPTSTDSSRLENVNKLVEANDCRTENSSSRDVNYHRMKNNIVQGFRLTHGLIEKCSWNQWIDNLHYRLNFDLDKCRQKFHHSLKEHHKISNIPKFRCEML
jgi:hypothetical protein